MLKIIRSILSVARRECLILLQHPVYLVCMVFAPFLVTVFFTSLMDEGLPEDMPVGIVDLDNTSTTRKLTRTLDSFQSSHVVAHYPSVAEARNAIQRGEIYAFMYFPKGTTDELLAQRQPEVSFYYSGTSLAAGSLLMKDLKTMCVLGNAAVGQATLQAKGYTHGQIMAVLQPITIDVHNIGNPWVSYNVYLCVMIIPGIVLLFVFLITAFSFGTELKFDTRKELMTLANDNIIIAILGKLLPQLCVFLFVLYSCFTYLFGILHFPAPGGIGMVYLSGLLVVIGSQGLALFIFALMPSLRMSMSICSLWSVLSFSMVGSAFPVFAMDKSLEIWSWMFPLRHYYMIYQRCIFNDFPLMEVKWHVVALIVFAFLPWMMAKRLGNAMRNYTYME